MLGEGRDGRRRFLAEGDARQGVVLDDRDLQFLAHARDPPAGRLRHRRAGRVVKGRHHVEQAWAQGQKRGQSVEIDSIVAARHGQHARSGREEHVDGADVRRIFRDHAFAARHQQARDKGDGLLCAIGHENFFLARGQPAAVQMRGRRLAQGWQTHGEVALARAERGGSLARHRSRRHVDLGQRRKLGTDEADGVARAFEQAAEHDVAPEGGRDFLFLGAWPAGLAGAANPGSAAVAALHGPGFAQARVGLHHRGAAEIERFGEDALRGQARAGQDVGALDRQRDGLGQLLVERPLAFRKGAQGRAQVEGGCHDR